MQPISRGASLSGSRKQQQVPIRIFDDESFRAPRFFSQLLLKRNTGRLKLKKKCLDLLRRSDRHRGRQQSFPLADLRINHLSLDEAQIQMRSVSLHLCVKGRLAVTEHKSKSQLLAKKLARPLDISNEE